MNVYNWNANTQYSQHQVVKINNRLYFCLTSNINVNPQDNNETNNLINPIWNTEDNFCWIPAYDSDIDGNVNYKQSISDAGLAAKKDFDVNKNAFSLNLTFDKLSNAECSAIITFLENRYGSKRFNFLAQNPYNQLNKYICKTWKQSWVFANNNTVSAVFERKF